MNTQQTIATHLDLNQSEISRLMTELQIDWKTTALDDIRITYIRKLRAVAAGHKSHDGLDLTRERVLSEQVERELKQLDLAERRGQLVNVEQLDAELQHMVAAWKVEVLGLSDKIKESIDALHGIDVEITTLEGFVEATLLQLARYDPDHRGSGTPAAIAGVADPDDS